MKNSGRQDLLQGIRAVAHGQSLLSSSITAKVLDRLADLTRKEQKRGDDLLSDREKEVLVLVAQGDTNKEIAAKLVLSENTVRNHVSYVLESWISAAALRWPPMPPSAGSWTRKLPRTDPRGYRARGDHCIMG